MKKLIVVLTVACFAVIAYAAAGPDNINLAKSWDVDAKKKEVNFPHAFHQTKNDCTECHMNADGGPLKNLKDGGQLEVKGKIKSGSFRNPAHNEFCWPCHLEKKVPAGKSCNKCH